MSQIVNLKQEFAQSVMELRKDISAVLSDTIDDLVREKIRQSVEENVYGEYDAVRTTEKYVRRGDGDGGLSDTQNPSAYKSTVTGLDYAIECFVKGNPDPLGNGKAKRYDHGDIVDIIESGEGYRWRKSDIYKMQPFPRPFMQVVEDDKEVDAALLLGIMRKGYWVDNDDGSTDFAL